MKKRFKNDLTKLLRSLIKNKPTSVFIDAGNFYHATSQSNIKIDYTQLYNWFKTNSKLHTINYYTAFDPTDPKQEAFLQGLTKIGYNIVKKPIKIFDSLTKGNMDIEVAVDALITKKYYENLILISGDGDFTYLVQELEKIKKKVIIIGVGGYTSFDLHQEAHNYFFLDRISSLWHTPRSNKQVKPNQVQEVQITTSDKEINEVTKPPKITKPQTRVAVKVKLPKKHQPKIIM